MPVFLNEISTALPSHRYDAEEITRFLISSADNEAASRKVSIVARKSGIKSRYSVLDDFRLPTDRRLFNGHNPKVEERMHIYQQEALPLAMRALEQLRHLETEKITHVITVSCTGMSAPGIELQIAHRLNLDQECAKHAVNFVGCHGAFHALKMARQMVLADSKSHVLIVSVELCSLHFQPSEDDDSILANALFGDGAAAVLLSSEPLGNKNIELDGFTQRYFPEQEQLMAWNIHSDGFLLKLSSYVPRVLEAGIHQLFDADFKDNEQTAWAVHPGGKNILDAVEKGLHLSSEKLDSSRKVLSQVGNLSSATILFVLEEILAQTQQDRPINALGFGPGITIEHFHGTIRA